MRRDTRVFRELAQDLPFCKICCHGTGHCAGHRKSRENNGQRVEADSFPALGPWPVGADARGDIGSSVWDL